MDNVFNSIFGAGSGFDECIKRMDAELPPKGYMARMLRDDLAYARKEHGLAMDRLHEAQADVRRYACEIAEAEAALKARGITP